MPKALVKPDALRFPSGLDSLLFDVGVLGCGCILRFDPEAFDVTLLRACGWTLPSTITRSTSKRQAEYFNGRTAAFSALAAAGATCSDLPVAPHGGPVWPPGWVGSISHCQGLAVAVAASSSHVQYLGVDVEHVARGEDLLALRQITMDAIELDLVDSLKNEMDADVLATAIFSAKESLYKALRAHVGRFFDFDAAQVRHIDSHAGTMTLSLKEDLGPAFPVETSFAVCFGRLDESTLLTLLVDQAACRSHIS